MNQTTTTPQNPQTQHHNPDGVLLLRSRGKVQLAKTWQRGGQGQPECKAYDHAATFTNKEYSVSSSAELLPFLTWMTTQPQVCALRGGIIRGRQGRIISRRMKRAKNGKPADIEDAPRSWVALDLDDVPVPDGVDPRYQPEALVRQVTDTLPEALQQTTCVWQYTSSTGVENWDTVGLRLWFRLTEPKTSVQVRWWLEEHCEGTAVDAAAVWPNQIIYTAAPVFADGIEDPVPQRVGLVEGVSAEVTFDTPTAADAPRARIEARRLRKKRRDQAHDRLEDGHHHDDRCGCDRPAAPQARAPSGASAASPILDTYGTEDEQDGTVRVSGDDPPKKRALNYGSRRVSKIYPQGAPLKAGKEQDLPDFRGDFAEMAGWDPMQDVLRIPEGRRGLMVTAKMWEIMEARPRIFRWYAKAIYKHHGPNSQYEGMRQAALKWADEAEQCGKAWKTVDCLTCGGILPTRRHMPVNTCKRDGCPICSRMKAQRYRAKVYNFVQAHPRGREKGGESNDYYMVTNTIEKRHLSRFGLREDAARLFAGGRHQWQQVLRWTTERAAGRNEDAGMTPFLELGPSGNLHTHALYYGAHHRVEALREVYHEVLPGTWFKVNNLKAKPGADGEKKELAGMISEVVKYIACGNVKSGYDNAKYPGEFVHPFAVVLMELSLLGTKRSNSYGSMRKIPKADDEEEPEATDEDPEDDWDDVPGDESEGEGAPCPYCGGRKWTWGYHERDSAWIPPGWAGKSRKKRKPDGPGPHVVARLELAGGVVEVMIGRKGG